jgi:hypothetical protein
MATVLAIAVGFTGCAPSPAQPPRAPDAPAPIALKEPARELTCRPAPLPPPKPHVLEHVGTGKATATVSKAAAQKPLDERTLHIVSEGAPLGSVALEVGHALGIDAAVEDSFGPEATYLDLDGANLLTLDAALANTMGVRVDTVRSGEDDRTHFTIYFESQATRDTRAMKARQENIDLAPIETRLIPVSNRVAIGVATHYCEFIASPRGGATVVGDAIIARDFAGNLNQLEELAHALEDPPPGPAKPK